MFALSYTLAHFFIPGRSNNFKSKLIHNSTLLLVIFSLIIYQITLQTLSLSNFKILGYAANISTSEVISITNQKRLDAGMNTLSFSPELEKAAKTKGEHMLANSYWAHVAPDGTEPWKFFSDAGYKYRYAGENLARDFSNVSSAVDAWMASPSHKDNLLSPKYQDIGIAVVEGNIDGVETTIIVQLFGTKLSQTDSQVPVASAKSDSIANSPATGTTEKPSAVTTVKPLPTLVSPTLSPTPTPVFAIIASDETGASKEVNTVSSQTRKILISPFESTRNVALTTTTLLLAVLAIDGIFISRRKITRISGRNFAHLAFLGMILAVILIFKAGKII